MKTHEMYVRELEEKNPCIECLGTYTKSTEKVLHKCKVCGHEWMVKPYTLVSKKRSGCPHCAAVKAGKANRSYTTDSFVEALREVNETIELIGEYSGSHKAASFKCIRCGHEWTAKPYSVLQGHGCPRCAKSGTSFMEQVLLGAMKSALGDSSVVSRNKTAIGEELDIYLPMLGIAFEPGSWAFHERRLWKDREKRKLCDAAGIRLVLVYDKFPEGQEPPFSEDCFVYAGDFNKDDHEQLWNMISRLLELVGHPKCFSSEEKSAIETRAYEESKSLTHEVFVERMIKMHPAIEVIGRYVNSNRRVRCKCTVCGWEWDAVPAGLLSGDGCRKCGAKARGKVAMLPLEAFLEKLEAVNATIEIDPSSYRGMHHEVHAKCLKCGRTWTPEARTLVRENPCGCSDCRKAEKLEKLDAKYREELRLSKPHISCLEKYATRETKLVHKCEICGFEWRTTPATVLHSKHGCPKWASHQAGKARMTSSVATRNDSLKGRAPGTKNS